ncbi:low temperature requirement protein A [Micromonospora sp. CPCC 205539]|uniref:low temperature requirement protein A n=1 Tax=Micromonospora sp. CPCC 205539 TaxID=3122408 RepID=UPI002FF25CCD
MRVLELFFELAFVVALTRVSHRFTDLTDDTGWAHVAGFGRTLLLFLALRLIWSHTTRITSRYRPAGGGGPLLAVSAVPRTCLRSP